MITELSTASKVPSAINTAMIALQVKPKDLTNPIANYWPLSLINKMIISKVLASRIEEVIMFLIHLNQTGFIKKRQSFTDIRTSSMFHRQHHRIDRYSAQWDQRCPLFPSLFAIFIELLAVTIRPIKGRQTSTTEPEITQNKRLNFAGPTWL